MEVGVVLELPEVRVVFSETRQHLEAVAVEVEEEEVHPWEVEEDLEAGVEDKYLVNTRTD